MTVLIKLKRRPAHQVSDEIIDKALGIQLLTPFIERCRADFSGLKSLNTGLSLPCSILVVLSAVPFLPISPNILLTSMDLSLLAAGLVFSFIAT